MGFEVVHFGFGESPFPPPKPFVAALKRHAADNHYLPSQGLPGLREAAAEYLRRRFGHDASPDRVIVGPGSKELIFDALLVLEGDLILPAPSWVSYAPQAKLLHKRVVGARTEPDNGYRLDPAALDAACQRSKSQQKILILNSPCNPTGAVYSAAELKELAQVAQQHNVVVISDEIYAEITFGRPRFASIASYCPKRTIVTTGLSKGFSAGGHRLGILMLPAGMESIMAHLAAVASETFSCVSTPVQHAAIVAFGEDADVRQHVEDTAAVHKLATEYLWRRLTKVGLRCPNPEGAFYLLPDFSPFAEKFQPPGVCTDVDLCADVLDKQGVAMLPGSAFGLRQDRLAVRVASVDYDGAAVLERYRKRRPRTQAQGRSFVERHCPNLALGVDRLAQYLDERT